MGKDHFILKNKMTKKETATKSVWLSRRSWKKVFDLKYDLGFKTMGDVVEYMLEKEVKNGSKRGNTNN